MLSVNSILMLWKLMNKQTITGETLYGPGLYGTMLAYKIIGSAQKFIGNTKGKDSSLSYLYVHAFGNQ